MYLDLLDRLLKLSDIKPVSYFVFLVHKNTDGSFNYIEEFSLDGSRVIEGKDAQYLVKCILFNLTEGAHYFSSNSGFLFPFQPGDGVTWVINLKPNPAREILFVVVVKESIAKSKFDLIYESLFEILNANFTTANLNEYFSWKNFLQKAALFIQQNGINLTALKKIEITYKPGFDDLDDILLFDALKNKFIETVIYISNNMRAIMYLIQADSALFICRAWETKQIEKEFTEYFLRLCELEDYQAGHSNLIKVSDVRLSLNDIYYSVA